MMKKQKMVLALLLAAIVVAASGWYLHGHTIPVLQPAGEVGTKERNLIIFCVLMSAAIVVPVFGLLIYFARKYREDAPHSKYSPELGGSRKAEAIWWLVPTFIMIIISIVTWQSSYALDPFRPLSSTHKTLHVQVVAMDWKWLFIYPDQQTASVNEVAVPVGTPVDFAITSDSVMTSFWVPQLGGQMYAMPGMSTHLNLVASKSGIYRGVAANISGKGFADMKFSVKALPGDDYNAWLAGVRQGGNNLTNTEYAKLLSPGTSEVVHYGGVSRGLYDAVVMKYMMPMHDAPGHAAEGVY